MRNLPLLVVLFAALNALWIFKLLFTYIVLKRERAKVITGDYQKKIAVILPVLLEKNRVKETVSYLLIALHKYQQSKIVLITTEKEFCYVPRDSFSTIDICKQLSLENDKIVHLHLPHVGKMADQVNMAVTGLDDTYIFGLFNADSRPEKKTFDYVTTHWEENAIFQQYGDYSKNLEFIRSNDTIGILQSACAWQNRWTLGYEYFNLLFYSRFNRIRMFSFLVGHGLFFSKKTWIELKGFDVQFHNEDSPFGLKAAWRKIPLKAIPFFDISDSPDTVCSLYKQKKSWFLGPFQAFEYHRFYGKRFHLTLTDCLFTIQLFWLSIIWILDPLFVLLSAILSIFSQSILLILPLIVVYQGLLNYFSMFLVYKLRKKTKKVPLIIILSSPLAYAIHGFAGLVSFLHFQYLHRFHKEIVKGKTIMRGDI